MNTRAGELVAGPFGMSKGAFKAIIALTLVLAAMMVGTVIASFVVGEHRSVVESQKTLSAICSTTGVLHDVVFGVYQRTNANIKNGYYDDLVRRKLLTTAQLQQVLDQQNDFKIGLSHLQQAQAACKEFGGTP